LSYGDVSFLLTSDLSAEAQIELSEAENYPLATVLQLPQHGTARSLERDFITAVQPQAVVVQADRANRRGDPDEAILAMLDKDTPVFRTDEDGVLHLWTNGESLWGETEN
jgi:competence protein ComEC